MVNATRPFPKPTLRPAAASLALALTLLLTGCEKPKVPNLYPPVVDVPVTLEEDSPENPIASPQAKRGGVFTTWAGGYPKSLNVWTDGNPMSAPVSGLMFESLAGLHPTQNEWLGSLAKSWEIGEDGLLFTFHLHPAAKWSDGKPITAADIRFYYDVIMDPKNLTVGSRVSLERLNPPEIVDDHTIRVRAKQLHWSNFQTAAGMCAFPKHVWEGKNFNEINFEFPVVSGPYAIEKVLHNDSVLMKRRGDWWARVKKENQFVYNFDYIRFKAMEDRQKAMDAFKQGQFDLFAVYTSSIWAQRTDFAEIQNNWVVKQKVYNEEPKSFQGMVINLRRPLFQDKNLREALSYLLDRQKINDKIMFNSYFLLNCYYPDLYPDNKKPDAAFYDYNPTKARELLAASGWKPNSQGILEKDGKTLSFKFLHFGPMLDHYNVYLEDLKKVGIDASMDIVDMAAATKRKDNHEFDLFWQNYGAARERDPEPLWSSRIADEIATSNDPGVKDEVIDQLIEQQKTILDIDQRNEILKQIDSRLTALVPYVLLWQSDHNRLLYWNKFGTPKYVLDKFNREDVAVAYWWLDPAKEKAFNEARSSGKPLPAEPAEVHWQD
jgi:microcin C transport system substrate-binding protein